MEFNGDSLTIESSMSMEEILEFETFIRPRLEYIEIIEVVEDGALKCSALLALLSSLKKTRNDLAISFLDKRAVSSPEYGTIHWICHD